MSRVIDLTVSLKDGMRGVTFEAFKELEKDGWNARMLHLYSHAGTHMDAPLHFGVNDTTVDRIPPERFVADAWVIDAPAVRSNMLIGIEHLMDVKDRLVEGEGLLFRTGWHRFIDTPAYRDALPRLSMALALWCVKKKVGLIGVEPPSVASLTDMQELREVHRILLGGGIVVVEGLCNLEEISRPRVKVIALPLKIAGGDGAPARVIAIEE
ncbi:MAG TPA: cyclase family protein [Syntrophales bacterium]|nr:cyclase family protein [Syntrophales bacterium]